MKEIYILFEADFDEGESFVQLFSRKEDILEFTKDWDDKDMYENLIKKGFHEAEWWNFHLVKVPNFVGGNNE